MTTKKLFLLCFGLLLMSQLSWAASPKTVTLNDGSVIKGDIIKLENGVYTIKSTQLGEIKVEEEKVLSITSAQAQQIQKSNGSNTSSQNSSLKDQVQKIQGQVVGNQDIMEKIQSLLDDPQIKQIISDPNLMKDIMTYDEDTIRSNANLQQLLNNPRIQSLIKDIEQQTQP